MVNIAAMVASAAELNLQHPHYWRKHSSFNLDGEWIDLRLFLPLKAKILKR